MKKRLKKTPPAAPALPAVSLRHWSLALPLLAWAAAVTYFYLKAYPIRFDALNLFFSMSGAAGAGELPARLLEYGRSILVAGAILFSAFGTGRFLVRKLRLDFLHEEGDLYATGLGLVALIYAVLAVGSAGLLYRLPVALLVLAGIGAGVREISLRKPSVPFSLRGVSLPVKALFAITLVQLAFVFIGALAPETFYDSLKYHVSVPQQWIFQHRIAAIPNFEYSYYPVNIHMLYLTGLLFGSDVTAKLLHFAFGLLSALAVYGWAARRFSRETGALAALLFFAVPFVSMVMWKTAIELGLAFFETLAALSFVNALTGEEDRRKPWLLLAAVFAGTAVGGKYLSAYAVAAMIAVGGTYLLLLRREPVLKTGLRLGMLAAVALLCALPYLVRNHLATGRFAYPFNISLTKDVTAVVKETPVEFNDPPAPERTLANFLTLPWHLTMGKKTQEPLSGALLLLCLPLALAFRNTDRRIRLLAWYALAYYLCWFFVRTYFRYMLPLMPVAAIVFAYFLAQPKPGVPYFRPLLLSAFMLLSLSNLALVVSIEFSTMDPFRVVTGHETKHAYLSTARPSYPTPYYQVLDWAGEHLSRDARILFLGECRGYYSGRPFITFTTSDFNPLVLWAGESGNAEELAGKLREHGVTHLLVNVPEARRLASYDLFHFEPAEAAVFRDFWNRYAREIRRDIADSASPQQGIWSMKLQQPAWWQGYSSLPQHYVYLYEIMPEEEAVKPHQAPHNFLLEEYVYSARRWSMIGQTVRGNGTVAVQR